MSKTYLNEAQVQQTAPLLPGLGAPKHPGVTALEAGQRPAPAEMLVDDAGQLILFEDQDVEMAIQIWHHGRKVDRKAAMREVMMHTLRCAAINTGVA